MKIPGKQGVHVQLNTAPLDLLDREVGLGPERARRIIEGRPFYSWEDVKHIEGFTWAVVENLARSGVELGDPTRAERGPGLEDSELQETSRPDVVGEVPNEGRRGADTRRS